MVMVESVPTVDDTIVLLVLTLVPVMMLSVEVKSGMVVRTVCVLTVRVLVMAGARLSVTVLVLVVANSIGCCTVNTNHDVS